MILRPPKLTLFPTRRSSDLQAYTPAQASKPQRSVEELIQDLSSDNPGVRKAAVRQLGYLGPAAAPAIPALAKDRKSTRLNSSHGYISYAVFCLKKKTTKSTA